MKNVANFVDQLTKHNTQFSLPAAFYNDEDCFASDMALIWNKSWIFIGHPADVPENGDFMCFRIAEQQLIIYRNEQGEIKAAHNRNAQGGFLVNIYKGNLNDFSLTSVDLADKQIALENCNGYLFISLAKAPSDFEDVKASLKPYMQVHHINDLKIAAESSIVEKGNWKLVLENNRECYHCLSNHPELVITLSDDPALVSTDADNMSAVVGDFWERCEAQNITSKFYMSDDGTYRIVRLPLKDDAKTYTMDGKYAVTKPISGLENSDIGAMVMFHFPNTWNHFMADHVLSFRVLPLSSQETLVTTKWLVNKAAKENIDYDLDNLLTVWRATNDQDRHLVEQNQIGINSPEYQPGPYSSSQEGGVKQFVDWYKQTYVARAAEKKTV